MRRLVLAGAVILIILQFIRPARNEGTLGVPADISHTLAMPDTIAAILKSACYDCHSNRTGYPWYAGVEPLGWWLASHIKKGKRDLDLSAFGNYSSHRQRSKLVDMYHTLKDGTMPLWSYRVMHQDARLSGPQKAMVMDWLQRTADSIARKQ